MNNTQAATLLAKINTFDQRNVTPQMAESWAQAIKKTITLEYAVKAVIEYYSDPRWGEGTRRPWIMPADINNRAPAIKDREHPQYHVARQIEASQRPRRVVHHFAGSSDFRNDSLSSVLGVSPQD
jgi:hypothetical protein